MNKTTTILVSIGVLILIAVLYFSLRSVPSQEHPSETDRAQQSAPLTDHVANSVSEVSFEYKKDGSVEPKAVRVKEGEKVIIKISSDVADEAHLHGYDKSTPVEPGKVATLELIANQTGRFPIELEQIKKEIGILEVYPK